MLLELSQDKHLSYDIDINLPINDLKYAYEIIYYQAKRIKELEEIIELQKAEIQRLNDIKAKDSHNSSKPPSTDGYRKITRSKKEKNKRKVGGQNGHKGSTLHKVDNPDKTIIYHVDKCDCGCNLENEKIIDYERRQVFDIPPVKYIVTEHKAEIKICPDCGKEIKGVFPEDVKSPVQYGNQVKSTAVYLTNYQLLPYERLSELFFDLYELPISQSSLVNINKRCSDLLEEEEKNRKEALIKSPTAHFDETGVRVNGKRNWLHSCGTEKLTFYDYHCKRGKEAMDEINILPHFHGRAIHDHWKPYFQYSCEHGLCNAHHIRELTFIYEEYNQRWAEKMINLLVKINKRVEEAKSWTDHLDEKTLKIFDAKYDRIIREGFRENKSIKVLFNLKKKGRKKQSKSKNLLDRLKKFKQETLAFMYDFTVSFTNNLGENDLRMMKVQQKISGAFRSEDGAKSFCRTRGYISTAKKNDQNVLDALEKVFLGKPIMPDDYLMAEAFAKPPPV